MNDRYRERRRLTAHGRDRESIAEPVSGLSRLALTSCVAAFRANMECVVPAISCPSRRARKLGLGMLAKVSLPATNLRAASARPGHVPTVVTGRFLASRIANVEVEATRSGSAIIRRTGATMQGRYHADGSFSGARLESTPGLGFSLTLDPEETDMRFSKEEGHFKTREQALAEIASVGWHWLERTFSAEDELHWHDFDSVAYVLQGTASAEYEDGTVERASAGCRIAAPAGIVHRNVGADWHGIIAFPVHPSQLTQPVNKPLAS